MEGVLGAREGDGELSSSKTSKLTPSFSSFVPSYTQFCSDQPISLTLPPYFRPYWTLLLVDKATAPPHRAWEFTTDPFTAKKAVEQRQDKRLAETTRREGLAAGDNSSGRSTPSSSGGGGTVMLSGEWERAPEVRMAPALRELVEETIRDQMTKYPDAILQATRESNGGEKSGEGEQEIKIDVRSFTVSLEGLGFRPSHVRSVVTFLQNALERIHNPSKKKEGEGLDPLVLALSTLSPQEAAIEWLILHLPEGESDASLSLPSFALSFHLPTFSRRRDPTDSSSSTYLTLLLFFVL